jgi:hypothetical protein
VIVGRAASTTSMPASGSSIAIRRMASRSWRPVKPPGSGVPVPGAMPGSTTSMSTDRNTAPQSSVAIANASVRHSSSPRVTISVISKAAHTLPGHASASQYADGAVTGQRHAIHGCAFAAPAVTQGQAVIAGTRVPVSVILDCAGAGMTSE